MGEIRDMLDTREQWEEAGRFPPPASRPETATQAFDSSKTDMVSAKIAPIGELQINV